MYLESDVAKIIVTAFVEWVVASGLKLQAEPIEHVIKKKNPNFKRDEFVKDVESRFRLLAKSCHSAFNGMDNFHVLQRKALKESIIGGDCLVVFRVGKTANAEVISGRHIETPHLTKYAAEAKKRGNKIVRGVEINGKGDHVAYYIRQWCEYNADPNQKYKRIEAKGKKSGRRNAVMIYGDEFRTDDVRGVPLFASSIEKIKKIDRYIEAVVASVEERSKVAYFAEHNHFSDGENPLVQGMKGANYAGEGQEPIGGTISEASKQVAMTTNKTMINMPVGATLKSIESTQELKMSEFVSGNFVYICASVGLPYEVALMKYENSFSASRMASQTWQQILNNKRDLFTFKSYKPFYDLVLEVDILNGDVQAEGYLKALMDDDVIMIEAYRNARFIGPGVPQADPSKEVKASVLKIQNYLSTVERESEVLGSGDFDNNVESLSREFKKILELIPTEFLSAPNAESDAAELVQEPKA